LINKTVVDDSNMKWTFFIDYIIEIGMIDVDGMRLRAHFQFV